MEKVRDWIQDNLDARGWKQIDLARRADIDRGTLSRLLTGQTEPSCDTLMKIAKAFGESPEKVFRLAGLLTSPDGTGLTDDERDLLRYFQLAKDPDARRNILAVVRVLAKMDNE